MSRNPKKPTLEVRAPAIDFDAMMSVPVEDLGFGDIEPGAAQQIDGESLGTTVPLKVKRVHDLAVMPQYQTDGAACFDLHAIIQKPSHAPQAEMIEPGDAVTFRFGLAFEVPPGYVMLVFSRSGHGFKRALRLCNTTGVIDSDFRGELVARLHNDGLHRQRIDHGERVAQAMVIPVPRVEIQAVEALSDTARGSEGFGSTGR